MMQRGRKGGERHFDAFEPHTRFKHAILKSYVQSWAQKILRGMPDRRAWFVDGFAGAGTDRDGNAGSPLIAAEIAAQIHRDMGPTPTGRARMNVIAFEADDRVRERLRESLAHHLAHVPRLVSVPRGVLSDRLPALVERIKDDPVLYFLDPFGVDGLVAKDLPKLLAGPSNEVFALFHHQGAARLYAALFTRERDVTYELAEGSQRAFWDDLEAEETEAKRRDLESRNRAISTTRNSSQEILARALGDAVLHEMQRLPHQEAAAWLTRCFARELVRAGARFVLELPVRNDRNRDVYKLVYATKSAVGVRTMKQAFHTAWQQIDLEPEVKERIGWELNVHVPDVADDLERQLAGQTIRWSSKDRKDRTLYRYLLEETAVFMHQMEDVKRHLIDRGRAVETRPLTFRFPPATP